MKGIEAVGVKEVRAVAERIIDRSKFHCAVVGPRLDDDEIANALG